MKNYLQIMCNRVSIKIIMILVVAAIVTVPSSVLQVSYAQTNQDLANEILAVHNRERTLVGVSPLTWNDNLAAGAQTWASISLRQASSFTTQRTQGYLVPVHAMVRTLQALSRRYPNQTGGSLDGSTKRVFSRRPVQSAVPARLYAAGRLQSGRSLYTDGLAEH